MLAISTTNAHSTCATLQIFVYLIVVSKKLPEKSGGINSIRGLEKLCLSSHRGYFGTVRYCLRDEQ